MSKIARRAAAGGISAVLLATLAGCSQQATKGVATVPEGGVSARSGHVVVNDVWVDTNHALRKGGDATVRFTLADDGPHPDALVGVTTRMARRVTLAVHDSPVSSIAVAPRQSADLEWHNGSGVILHDITHRMPFGQFFPLTFHFSHSPSVTMRVDVGPLGGRHAVAPHRRDWTAADAPATAQGQD